MTLALKTVAMLGGLAWGLVLSLSSPYFGVAVPETSRFYGRLASESGAALPALTMWLLSITDFLTDCRFGMLLFRGFFLASGLLVAGASVLKFVDSLGMDPGDASAVRMACRKAMRLLFPAALIGAGISSVFTFYALAALTLPFKHAYLSP